MTRVALLGPPGTFTEEALLSQPGSDEPTPQKTSDVFHGPGDAARSAPARASQTKRVSLSATSSTPARRISQR